MRTKRVLIVEDHEPTRYALRSILKRKGYEVTEAGTIAAGVDLVDRSPPPDCVVLDMDLPDGRGEAVLRAIRDGHMDVRVAVCSGMSDSARWDALRLLGPETMLRKPVNAADVCKACEPGHTA